AHPLGALLPAADDVEVRVEVQEAARAVAGGVAEHRHHHRAVGQAVDGVRGGEVGPAVDHVRLDRLVQAGGGGVGGVHDVNAAGAQARQDQVAADPPGVAVAGAADVPAEVV